MLEARRSDKRVAVISKTVTNNTEFDRQSTMSVEFYVTFDENVGVEWNKHRAGYERQQQTALLPFAYKTNALETNALGTP